MVASITKPLMEKRPPNVMEIAIIIPRALLLVVSDIKLLSPNHSIGTDMVNKIIACFFLLVIWFSLKFVIVKVK